MISDSNDLIWIFGGYNPAYGPLQDIRAFDAETNSFKVFTIQSQQLNSHPNARFFHAASFSPLTNHMYLYGGMNLHSYFADFWKLDLVKLEWEKLETDYEDPSLKVVSGYSREKLDRTPSLAGHTLTFNRDSKSLILIGGYSALNGYNQYVLEYDLLEEAWKAVPTLGYGPRGIYGHTTVYNSDSKSFYVFGGNVFHVNSSFTSNKLWTFHHPSKTWSIVPFDHHHSKVRRLNTKNVPLDNSFIFQPLYHLKNAVTPRMFHTAVPTRNYMLIFGGDVEKSRNGFSDILVYSFNCATWLKIPTYMAADEIRILSRKHIEYLGVPIISKLGLRSVRLRSGFIYIVGGSSGRISDQLVRMYFPEDLCRLFDDNAEDCLSFPGCSFCQARGDDISSRCFSGTNVGEDKCSGGNYHQQAGPSCDPGWVSQENRDCDSFRNCGDCLAEFPIYGSSPVKSRCQVNLDILCVCVFVCVSVCVCVCVCECSSL